MAKEFKDWIDEFVENGANPKDVTNWPENAGGGGVVKVDELPENPEPLTIYEITKVIPPAPTGMLSLAKAISKDFNFYPSGVYAISSDSQIESTDNNAKYYNYTNDTRIEFSSGQKYVINSEGNVGFFPSLSECIVKEVKGEDPSDPENKVLVVTLDGKEVSIERDNYNYIDILKELSGKNLIMTNTAYQTKVVEDIENEITAEYLINNDLIYKGCPEDVYSFYNGLEQYITEDGRCFGLFTSGEIIFDDDNYRFVKNGEPYTGKFISGEWLEVNDKNTGMNYEGPYPLEVRNTPKFCSSGEIYILDAPEPGPAPEPTVVTEHYIWQDEKWYNLDNLPSATTKIVISSGSSVTLNATKLLELLIKKGVDVDAEMSAGYSDPWYSGIAIGTEYDHMPSLYAGFIGICPFLSSGDIYAEFAFSSNGEGASMSVMTADSTTIRDFLNATETITIKGVWNSHVIFPSLGVMTDSEEDMHSYTLTNEEFDSIIEIS